MADHDATTLPNPHVRARLTAWLILTVSLVLLLFPAGVAAQDESPFADEDPFANDTDPFADTEDPLAGYEDEAKAAADAVLDEEGDDAGDDDAGTSDDLPPSDESNGIPGFTAVSLVGILALVGYRARRLS